MRPSWRWAARALCVALLLPSPARSDEHAEPSACPFLDARCPERLPYRPIDGTCNNLAQPWMGRAKSPTLRLLPAAYSHEHAGRLSQAGTPLPSAQVIASRLMPQEDHQGVTSHLFVLWAQVVSHDFAMRAAPKNSVTGPCCGKNAGKNCIAIPVPEDDPFYSQFNLTCLPMGRTNTTTCSSREPDTMSGSTHFLDASFIYGSNKDTMKRLRQLEGGLLRVRDTPEGPFPPNVANPAAVCGQEPCYDTGDPRTNQTPMLAAIQTLWLREHNRVARALAAANPRWSDEVLFQEARRIVVAEWQVITFRDWLPWLLGPERVDSLRLAPRGASPASEYDPAVDPRTANEVTTAAFRALHSMVQGRFWVGRHGARTERISDWLLNPGPILEHEDGLLDVLQGMSYQQSQDQDRWMDNEISQQYEPIRTADGRRMGHNLIAVDIQRGRDHALPGYVAFRKYVGLPVAKDFGDLSDVLSEQDIQALRDIYEHVSDVDLYVGGLMERRKKGASLFGPTFQALLEDQFWRWRYADRFFFNFLGFDHSLNQDQILSLENTSVSRLFCDNVKGFKYVPQDAFVKAVHNNNEDVSCELLPKVDLTLWKDVKHGYLFPLSPITFPS